MSPVKNINTQSKRLYLLFELGKAIFDFGKKIFVRDLFCN